jgi:polyhydroxyalkanoic acid synthase PhaR subunit
VSEKEERSRSSADFADVWRQWYQQSEQVWSKAFEQVQGTEGYAALLGQTMNAYMESARLLREQMTRSLETMNLPSRDDFARLAAQVVALEAKIDDLDEKLDQVLDRLAAPAPGSPAQPSKRPKR